MIYEWPHKEHNQEQYYTWLDKWENVPPQYIPEFKESRPRYLHYMRESYQPTYLVACCAPRKPIKIDPIISRNWLLAASTVFFLLRIFGWLGKDSILYITYRTNNNEIKKIQLSDGNPTLVIRQNGEAWQQPFAIVYESFAKDKGVNAL
ncbi:hypothetical protein [Dyadobacter tibetensis]|uniref:hypothetical protein n=1 Tax=Dyadobacter tibetensis TaxID=1211851 RepID=UPI0004700938|nr:hypothetical protein [Dyadobacter tibetensis]